MAVLAVLIIVASILLVHGYYLSLTIEQPAVGGQYTEGMLGSPQYLNPALANNDIDRDLTRIIFSSLFKQDQNNNLTGDLADRYEIGDFGKIIDVWLKDNVVWHDGEKLTADDIIFTIKTIQDPAFKSPLRPNLSGIEIEKIDDYYLRFRLKTYYAPFLQNLTFGILPKHLWQNISASQFPLHELNLKPVGSGPFSFATIKKNKDGEIKSINLTAFADYFTGRPYLKNLTFNFYRDQETMLNDLNQGVIEGLNYISPSLLSTIKDRTALVPHILKLPRYFAVFLNQNQSTALANRNVRLALNYATDKQKIVDQALQGYGQVIDGPIIPGILGYQEQPPTFTFDQQKTRDILAQDGWSDQNGDGFLEKGAETLALGIVTLDWPELKKTAELLKEAWEAVGIKVDLNFEDIASLQQTVIRPRQYQALIFGEILAKEPDPFAFWHSSQKTDPGLNIALYDNQQADKLLSDARQELDEKTRQTDYRQFEQLIVKDVPAVFLYTQNYLFVVKKSIAGIRMEFANTPAERFNFINEWYIKTERAWK
ncbi:MAG: hypothetical protein COU85_00425 [Candidatus Portnoybacteria bacterium CG10_big_fil_rev_8_21_14_0_10_44_7]|uniref:Solute-binding protein family 5 domain-containing protein n=1 Tax=Candidatus Portnoybacteria bacterium CG10_big_fil_rev_8_21_14_0_10_44_7 TaxID=1974816 RepID=A0A2M8KJE0_9BACT|nr:MAG: hypothetical protein COU85_00425 [Candidatus Portnoybacteria bacterium CG10_big_fil_rev_8_21_14_0_10_44_7]